MRKSPSKEMDEPALDAWPHEPKLDGYRLLRARHERPCSRRAAECGQQFPPSDVDCHTPLPCEVRKGKDTTSQARSLAVQGGQDAGCFQLGGRLQLHYSRRQLFANAAIAASRSSELQVQIWPPPRPAGW